MIYLVGPNGIYNGKRGLMEWLREFRDKEQEQWKTQHLPICTNKKRPCGHRIPATLMTYSWDLDLNGSRIDTVRFIYELLSMYSGNLTFLLYEDGEYKTDLVYDEGDYYDGWPTIELVEKK